ncbi:MAG: haloacid dehalogenase-like hydrolase, partial [Clostridia bacterium]|nr:haloacid dehalogenase-like hydrolase [Clostridia bacterium]
AKVYKMMRDNRIRYFAPANYSDGSDLDMLVKTIIDRTVKNEAIESTYFACRKEQIEEDKKSTEEGKEKRDLILQLEESRSFATTHAIIDKLRRITSWTQDECDDLIDIAIQNSQVYYILNDSDVRKFYEKILKENKKTTANSKKLEELFGE